MILGILNQGKMTSFVNILELQKLFLDLSLKKASIWSRFNKSQKTIMKLTKISPKINSSLINWKKKCTFMTFLRNEDFTSLAQKSKFLIIKKILARTFNWPMYQKSPLKHLSKILTPRNGSNFSLRCQKRKISQK